MEKMNVMVTGVGGGGHGEQILKALKLAQDLDLHIVGADMSPLSKGLKEVDHEMLLPSAEDPNYIDALLTACKKHEISALFHGSEPELNKMAVNRDLIESEGIFLPINPNSVIDICMDKFKTIQFLDEYGFNFPKSCQILSMDDISKVDFYPAVIKPSVGGGGSANVMIVQNPKELELYSHFMLKEYREFLVQEYVGTPEEEYTVGILHDMDGEYINSIAVRRNIKTSLSNRLKIKNRTGRDELGAILAISSGVSQGEIGRFSEVTEPSKNIADALGTAGPINVQCRMVNGELYLFEINPRFSGTTSLRAMVGYNEPEVLIKRHVLGQKIEKNFSYKSGFILRGLSETFFEK